MSPSPSGPVRAQACTLEDLQKRNRRRFFLSHVLKITYALILGGFVLLALSGCSSVPRDESEAQRYQHEFRDRGRM